MTTFALPLFHPERCNGCGLCLRVCPQGVFSLVAGRARYSAPERCAYCGECELACPRQAVELYYEIVQGMGESPGGQPGKAEGAP